MTEGEASGVLELLETAGIGVWVDGGWGVDALLGQQTRSHGDLDLALDRDDLGRARTVLETHGFQHDEVTHPGLPARLVMRHEDGRKVDFHPLVFDRARSGWQQLSESGRSWGWYPADDLDASGAIGGRKVRCLSPQLQARFRLGYEWSERDEHDLRLLIEHFDVSTPPALQSETHK